MIASPAGELARSLARARVMAVAVPRRTIPRDSLRKIADDPNQADLRTGKNALTLGGSELGLTDVFFSPDGTRLATGSGDGSVRIYVLPVSELMAVARHCLTRGWRHEECVQFLQRDRCPKPSSATAARSPR